MRKKLIKLDRKKLVTMMALSFMLSAVFVLQIGFPVLAAENDGSTVIQTGLVFILVKVLRIGRN